MANLSIAVIGKRHETRNPELERELVQLGLKANWIDPVLVDARFSKSLEHSERDLMYALNGRVLSLGERGCALAHLNAFRHHVSTPDDWLLVLEDDATLSKGSGHAIKELASLRLGPAVVLLFTPPSIAAHSSKSANGAIVAAEAFPSGAVGYLINKSACALALDDETKALTPADFPVFQLGVKFFRVSGQGLVSEVQGSSSIGHIDFSKPAIFKLYFVKVLFGFISCLKGDLGPLTWFRYSILRPLRRDIEGIWRRLGLGVIK